MTPFTGRAGKQTTSPWADETWAGSEDRIEWDCRRRPSDPIVRMFGVHSPVHLQLRLPGHRHHLAGAGGLRRPSHSAPYRPARHPAVFQLTIRQLVRWRSRQWSTSLKEKNTRVPTRLFTMVGLYPGKQPARRYYLWLYHMKNEGENQGSQRGDDN